MERKPLPRGVPCPYILRKPHYYGQLLCPFGKKALTQGSPPALTFYGNLIIMDSCFVPMERKPLFRGVPCPYILRKPHYYRQLLCPYGKKALTQGGPPALTFYGNLIIIDS